MDLLSPRKYGFKHEEWRPLQADAIQWLLEDFWKRVVVVEAPPGIGKTPLALAYAMNHGLGQTYIVTSTKQLQTQYEKELDKVFSMKGMSNYPCLELEAINGTCDMGPCHSGWTCPRKDECYYYEAKRYAADQSIVVTNYAYLLNIANYDQSFEFPPVLILDEAHAIEDELLGFVGDTLSEHVFEGFQLEWSPSLDWYEVQQWLNRVSDEVKELVSTYDENEVVKLGKTFDKVQDILANPDGKFVIELRDGYVDIKPVFARQHVHKLFQTAERIVLMSATMRPYPRMLELLGLSLDEAQVLEVPSDFDPARRPIWFWPVANVSYKTRDEAYPALVQAIDQIMDARPGVKGIIHTVSFELARYIKEQSRHSPRLLSHHFGVTREEVIDQFKESKDLWLVSPSIEHGIDLPYDECRVNVIAKVPYGNLGSKQTRMQYEDNPVIYLMKTVHRLIQMIGRAMRAPDDWGETFILDEQADNLYFRRRKWFPDHIVDSWHEITSIDEASMEVQLGKESR